jgi:hypothetical protein
MSPERRFPQSPVNSNHRIHCAYCTLPTALRFNRHLSRAFSLIGIDTVPEPIMTLLATRVTPPNLRVERITALLEIDRGIRAPLILNRPINAVGPSRLNLVHHSFALGRAGGSADASAHLVGEGGRAGECCRRSARVDAVSEAIARGCRGPLGAAGPDLAWLEDAAGGHAAGRGDVERDFGVGGVPGAVEVFELEELGLQFSAAVAAVAAMQRRGGGDERCWDSR